MDETNTSKPLNKILTELTGEQRFDKALHSATKDLVRFKLQEAERQIKTFEQRYGMTFDGFQQAWENGQITDKYSYEVEKDYWEWETAQAELPRLLEIFKELP